MICFTPAIKLKVSEIKFHVRTNSWFRHTPTPDWVSWILPLTINHGTIILWSVYPRTTCVSYSSWQLFSFFLLFARERHDEQWNLVEEASKLTSVLLLVGDVLVFCYLLLILVWYLAYVRLPFYQRQRRMQITRNSVHKKNVRPLFPFVPFIHLLSSILARQSAYTYIE